MDAPRPLSVAEAQARLLVRFRRNEAESVALTAALGRTLAADAFAARDLPSFTNSAMDGYAVRALDTNGASAARPVTLAVIGMHAAGDAASLTIRAGEAAMIATGAPLPAGADAVVRLEETDGGVATVTIRTSVAAGVNVRRQGETVRVGTTLLLAGTRLSPGQIALLAAAGDAHVSVVRRPRIAILSTGNELHAVGEQPGPGQIPDTNGPLLAALITQYGGDPVPLGIARDTPDDLRRAFDTALDVDCIITTGGVSVGAYDAVRVVIAERGALDFWRVRMRPGHPVACGVIGATPILALPGNPVAAFVAFHVLARPALARLLGQKPELPPTVPARLMHAVENRGEQQTYVRARLRVTPTGWEADTTMEQAVGNVAGLSEANGLVIIPEGIARVAEGRTVQIILWGE
ncbi:MAG: molybdopterin molybdotransferase MoeA [Chloroflexota bacterium]|nr:molybdopterin molybdotransferase MoeA [Chloroflexota bacterium]